jgi:methylglyoxal synthase
LKRTIALVAHDNKKADLVEWIHFNKGTLALHELYATGGTGKKNHRQNWLKNCLT